MFVCFLKEVLYKAFLKKISVRDFLFGSRIQATGSCKCNNSQTILLPLRAGKFKCTRFDNLLKTNGSQKLIPFTAKKMCRHRLLSLEEQRKLVKFRRFLSASNIANKVEFLSRIKVIRSKQKREARRSIVDEHGVPPDYTQSR